MKKAAPSSVISHWMRMLCGDLFKNNKDAITLKGILLNSPVSQNLVDMYEPTMQRLMNETGFNKAWQYAASPSSGSNTGSWTSSTWHHSAHCSCRNCR